MLQSRVVQRHLEHEEKVKSKGEKKNMQLIVWFQDEKRKVFSVSFEELRQEK